MTFLLGQNGLCLICPPAPQSPKTPKTPAVDVEVPRRAKVAPQRATEGTFLVMRVTLVSFLSFFFHAIVLWWVAASLTAVTQRRDCGEPRGRAADGVAATETHHSGQNSLDCCPATRGSHQRTVLLQCTQNHWQWLSFDVW